MRICALLCLLSPLLVSCDVFNRDDGRLTLAITDAPLDGAAAVTVRFTGVELLHEDGERERFDFNPAKDIDLLALSGGDSLRLLSDERIPTGRYERIRLFVESSETSTASHVDVEGVIWPLYVPSDATGGLSLLEDFTVGDDGITAYTIDFDLRRSVHAPAQPGGAYRLRPALRLVEDDRAGVIAGSVASARLVAGCVPAVYVYNNEDVTPDDIGGNGVQPLTSAWVRAMGDGSHRYDAAFLDEGDYTVAFTCDADEDDPSTNDTLSFTTKNATVRAQRTTTVNF